MAQKKKEQENGVQQESSASEILLPEPLMSEYEARASRSTASTRTRGNRSAYIERTNRFSNIEDGLVPFKTDNRGSVTIKDAVELCQKAYYNFAIFRNTIDLMTEFSVGDLYLEGGSKKSRAFFDALFKKINIWNLQDQFFREYYRSGNIFLYRFDYTLSREDIEELNRVFGGFSIKDSAKLPARYVILDPGDMQSDGSISFYGTTYSKVLSAYEIAKLKNPSNDEERAMFDALPEETQKQINKGMNVGEFVIPLDITKSYAIFYKKQDYEPFAVPLGYPVLEDINYKKELRKMDMAISRTMQQAILLVTTGADPSKGGVNPKNLKALQDLFANESVGRVLIADYTTEAKFVIPQIADILDPKKYEVLDRDIREGLGNILLNEEKFANARIKIQVFTQKLNESRKAFLRDFLQPEIRRITKELGLKSAPTAKIQEIDLENEMISGRIFNRLIELGVLTPEEGLEALQTGRLPNHEDSLESQRKFKEYRESGIYQPLIGGKQDMSGSSPRSGRPSGSGGESNVETTRANFSMKKVVENFGKYDQLEKIAASVIKDREGIKRLSKRQNEVVKIVAETVARNNPTENWDSLAVKDVLDNPVSDNNIGEIEDIAVEHGVDMKTAILLFHSKA